MNLVEGRIEAGPGAPAFRGVVQVPVGTDLAELSAGPTTLGVRPEHIEIVDAGHPDAITARVDLVERVGSHSNVLLVVAEQASLIASVNAAARIREGDDVHIRLPPEQVHVFDAEGRRIDGAKAMS
jgi:ABC-type sugar transport system ATPase subunit